MEKEIGLTAYEFNHDHFGSLPDGRAITRYTCRNQRGTQLQLIDYGAIITSLETTDRDGQLRNITLGFDTLDGYLLRHPYFGASVGRFCNRIGRGSFSLDGKHYELAKNNGDNHLHGGVQGFDRGVWQAEKLEDEHGIGVRFRYESQDGEEGYPGNLSTQACYQLNQEHELRITFSASTDQATPVNLTNHAYWNLAGEQAGDVLEHEMQIEADHYVPVNESLIPTGDLASVEGTPLDFRCGTIVGERFDQLDADPIGYDHCYVVRGVAGELRRAATVREPRSGRVMVVETTQPGIQFYTGNFLDGSEASGNYAQHGGFCLETQHYPDSPNQPTFPSTILRPGEQYRQTTIYRFDVE